MPGAIQRNLVVKYFGTPNDAEGSVNEPREREENGMRFNEKWVYRHPLRDPAEAIERIIYWRRYDYVGSVIRTSKDGALVPDDALEEFLQRGGSATSATASPSAIRA